MSNPWPRSSFARPEDWMSKRALCASLIIPCLNAQIPSWTMVRLYRILTKENTLLQRSLMSCCAALHLPDCLPVRAGQRVGCCPAGGSLASDHGPDTSGSAERGGKCGRGLRMYGYGRCDLWRRWICRGDPWSQRCPPPPLPPDPVPTEQHFKEISQKKTLKQTSDWTVFDFVTANFLVKITFPHVFWPWTLPGGPDYAGGPCSQTCSKCAWFCVGRCDKSPPCCLCSPDSWAGGQWWHKPVPHL